MLGVRPREDASEDDDEEEQEQEQEAVDERWGWTERAALHLDGAITHHLIGDVVRVCDHAGAWDWELKLQSKAACNWCTRDGLAPCNTPSHGCGATTLLAGCVFIKGASDAVPGAPSGVCLSIDEAYRYYHPMGVEFTLMGESYWDDRELRNAGTLRHSMWRLAAARMGVRFAGDLQSCARDTGEAEEECGEEEAMAYEEEALAAEEEVERGLDEREDAVLERIQREQMWEAALDDMVL